MAVNTQHTPRSTPALPILHWTFTPKCILKVTYQAAITISSIPKNHRLRDNLRHIISNLPKNIEILKHNHFHYRLLSYNDYLIQRNLTPIPISPHRITNKSHIIIELSMR
ncbi:unnamed protein product [Rhizophagus irregularis]|nr:unnamed protein product [Rhizophagus irregularis]